MGGVVVGAHDVGPQDRAVGHWDRQDLVDGARGGAARFGHEERLAYLLEALGRGDLGANVVGGGAGAGVGDSVGTSVNVGHIGSSVPGAMTVLRDYRAGAVSAAAQTSTVRPPRSSRTPPSGVISSPLTPAGSSIS